MQRVDQTDWIRIILLIGVLILVAPGAIMVNRRRGTTLTHVAIWLGIAAVIAGLYRLFGPE